MHGYRAHDSEAAGLAAGVPADAVHLRFGPADFVLRLLRWVLVLAGSLVALWLGSVLMATPASAAVVVPMAATSSLQKGGKDSSSTDGGKNGSSKSDDGSRGSGKSKSSDNGNEKSTSGESGKKQPKTDDGGEKKKPKSDGGEKKKPKSDGGEKKKPKNDGGEKKKPKNDGGEKKKPKNDGGEKKKPKTVTVADVEKMRDRFADDPQGTVRESTHRTTVTDGDRDRGGDGKARQREKAGTDRGTGREGDTGERPGRKKDAGESRPAGKEGGSGRDTVRAVVKKAGAAADEIRATVDEIVRDALDGRGRPGGKAAEKIRDAVRETITEAVTAAAKRASVDSADDAAEKTAKKTAKDSPKTSAEDSAKAGRNTSKEPTTTRLAEWGEYGAEVWKKVAAVRTAAEAGGDVRKAVRDLVRTASDLPEGVTPEDVRRAAAFVTDLVRAGVDEKSANKLAAQKFAGQDHGDVVLTGQRSPARCSASVDDCAGLGSAPDELRAMAGRGPPSWADDRYGRSPRHGGWYGGDDWSSKATEEYLENRVAVEKGAKELEKAQKDAAAGKLTAKELEAAEKAQKEREEKLAESREYVSDDDAQLVDEVVTGHAELDKAKAALEAEQKKVAAGTVSKAEHEKNVAAYEQRRDEVYAQTDELRQATGRDAPTSEADPGDGAAAGCGASGVFVECRAAVAEERDRDQDRDAWHDDERSTSQDRCVALAGISSGCGVSVESGDRAAGASCDLTAGACTSNSRKGSGEAAVTATARFELGEGDGGQRTRATSAGAEMECRTTAGACSGETSGAARDATTATERTRATAASTEERSGAAKASANCATTAGECGIAARVQLGEETTAEASARCASDAAGCTGAAATSSNGEHTVIPAVVEATDETTGKATDKTTGETTAKTAAEATGEPAAEKPRSRGTTAAADCSITGGGCWARSGSDAVRGGEGASRASVEIDGSGSGKAATASTADGVATTRDGSGSADCTVTEGSCGATSDTRADNPTARERARWSYEAETSEFTRTPGATVDGDGAAVSAVQAWVDCDTDTCTGSTNTATTGKIAAPGRAPADPKAADAATAEAKPVTAVRETKASASCETAGGQCSSRARSEVGDSTAHQRWSWFADTPAERQLTAASEASANAECAQDGCAGKGAASTSGSASGDVTGVRDSRATTECTVHGVGGSCSTAATTAVENRSARDAQAVAAGVEPVTGPVSVSTTTAEVSCSGADTGCGGTTLAATSARDTAVSPDARGSSTTSECTVTGGGCTGRSTAAASSAPDHVTIDPETGEPLAGQSLTGPSSVARSEAVLDCSAVCAGTVTTTSSAFDGTTVGPRTSTGTASCTGGTGGCQVRSVSTAASGPGAALALAGDGQATNAARLPAGASAASAAGALVICQDGRGCTGTASSGATATDPSVSPNPRGSWSESVCEGVTGGICQGVSNSGASSGPDANRIAPILQAAPTSNATTTSGTTGDEPTGRQGPSGQEPAVPPAPTAPGSSANTGGPTVPGASSWTMADAALDCAGSGNGCAGTARTSAAGTDGPQNMTGADGSRGPPTGASTTSGTCVTGQADCQVRTSSIAASGQVVADIVAEQNQTAAEQLAQQAADARKAAERAQRIAARPGATTEDIEKAAEAKKAAAEATKAAEAAAELAAKPVTDTPATYATSNALAQCSGPLCAAATTADATYTAGDLARSHSRMEAACLGGPTGCAAEAGATAVTAYGSGQADPDDPKGRRTLPGWSGSTQAAAQIDCPAGCIGTVTGRTATAASPDGDAADAARAARRPAANGAATDPTSVSTAEGTTACSGAEDCVAALVTEGQVGVAPTGKNRTGVTGASIEGACSTAAGACPVSGRSVTVATDDPATIADALRTGSAPRTARTSHAVGVAECAGPACQVVTGGSARDGLARVEAGCVGTGCTTRLQGAAQSPAPGGAHTASARSACTAATDGQCSGAVQVGATSDYALAGAECAGTPGADCAFSFRAEGHARSATSRADATAHGRGTTGSGAALVSAQAARGTAQAMAECRGTDGVECHHSYAARAGESAAGPGSRASASASGSGSGGRGRGAVAVAVRATAGPGWASAAASCTGAPNCRHSYSASASASAASSGSRASAYAAGSGGGGVGHGGVAVSARAWAGPGQATASASCVGAANCRYSYSASASGSASYDDGTHRSWAHANASGSGGGVGEGSGGIAVHAVARAGKGYSYAAAGCSGATNCTASYSSHAEASQTVGGQHGEARSSCSGGGSGGYCSTQAVVKVDAENAFAQAGCAGTGSCSAYYATRSAASAKGNGISGDAGGTCSGSQASGGYCATGSRAVHDEETGRLELSSYCATSGGSCSRWANLSIDAKSPGGEFTGTGGGTCRGGVGSCGLTGVAKYHPAGVAEDGTPTPPMLVVGTGCQNTGAGSCSHWSKTSATIQAPGGAIRATAENACSGTGGWCSTVVGGAYDKKTGEITAFSDCQSEGATCTKSEAHLVGSISREGQAEPNGPELGTITGDGKVDCVRTGGLCTVYGKFVALDPEQAYQVDDQGRPVLDENGNKIYLFETDEQGNQVLDENGKPIPVYLPARVNVQTSCYPAGPHCTQEAHVKGSLEQRAAHDWHTGSALADCSGTSGGCNLTGTVSYDPEAGRVAAFAACQGDGAAKCTRVETSTRAYAESPDGRMKTSQNPSDCKETAGFCSSISVAKFVDEYIDAPPPCTSPHGCIQPVPKTIPAHLEFGSSCDTDGPASGCTYEFSASGSQQGSGDDGKLTASARSSCSDSGNVGGGWCSIAANAEVNTEEHRADAVAWCLGSAGVTCSYEAKADASHASDKNDAEAHKACAAEQAGSCSISVSAFTMGGDDERRGVAVASGNCTDTNGTCRGQVRIHVDSDWDTLADCSTGGNGICYGDATSERAETGGRVYDEHTKLTLHVKAPGGEDNRVCDESSGGCVDGWSAALDGKVIMLGRNTEKSVPSFFKNLGRDAWDVVTGAVPGLLHAVGKELKSWVTFESWGDGLAGYAENRPLTGGIAQGAVNFWDRWVTDKRSLGDDYYFRPFSTALEDVGTVALVAAGAGAVLKGLSLGVKGAGALAGKLGTSSTGIRGALAASSGWLASVSAGLNVAAKVAWHSGVVLGNTAMTPLKINFAAARFAVGRGTELVAPRLATAATAAATILRDHGLGRIEAGRIVPGMRSIGLSHTLSTTAGRLTTAGLAGKVIARGGVFGRINFTGTRYIPGLIGTLRAYGKLGLQFSSRVSPEAVAAAQLGLAARVVSRDATPAWLDRFVGPRLADELGQRGVEIRQRRVERIGGIVQTDQLLRGVGAPAATVRPTTPAAQLTPVELAGLSGVPAREIRAAGCRGLCVVDDFVRDPQMHKGDYVLFTRDDLIVVDQRLVEAVRDSRISQEGFADLVRHHLAEIETGVRGEPYALPDLASLTDGVGRTSLAQAAAPDGPGPPGGSAGRNGSGDPSRPARPVGDPGTPALPASPTERVNGARPHTAGGGHDAAPGLAGRDGSQHPHTDDHAAPPTRDGEARQLDPAADNIGLPPPGTTEQARTSGTRTDADFAAEVAATHSVWQGVRRLTDGEILRSYQELAEDVRRGKLTVEDALIECTALACEAARRTGKTPRDDQIAAAIALARGDVVQMLTGEGKTLTGSLAALAHALDARNARGVPAAERGVQWLTLNEKLVRDVYATLRPIADRLGVTVDVVVPTRTWSGKWTAYRADIAIGMVSELVFDVLRARNARGEPVHQNRGGFRLIDEVDRVLLDEGHTPHVLSKPVEDATAPVAELAWAAHTATQLDPAVHFTVGRGGVRLTRAGVEHIRTLTKEVHGVAGRDLTGPDGAALQRRVENALAADLILQRDVHYVRTDDGRILIVDKHGELLSDGRRWNNGLHEAVEYAENVPIGTPAQVLDSMTVLEFLEGRPYAGMTGTAGGPRLTGKDVVEIRPHKGMNRRDTTVTYRTAAEKWDGIFDEIVQVSESGRPVLVLAGSELDAVALSERLTKADHGHKLVTALTEGAEMDQVLAEAGRPGRITVATNRANRGVDPPLGGHSEYLAREIAHREHPGLAARDKAAYESILRAARLEAEEQVRAAHDLLNEAGGLHVVITEFPESVRIEMQGRGRAGRQGENGSSTVHRSLEDRVLQPPGKREYRAPRVEAEPVPPVLDSVGVDTLFELARQEAELAARYEQRTAVHEAPLTGRIDIDGPAAQRSVPPANPAGVDLLQLTAARAGQQIPGLTEAQNLRLTELVNRYPVEHAPRSLAEHYAALEVADLIPQRSWQPYRYTAADVEQAVAAQQSLLDGLTAIERADELAERLGMDTAELAATVAVAEQLLIERRTGETDAAPVGDPAERLRLTALTDRELQAFLAYASGASRARIAEQLGVPVEGPAGVDWYLGLDPQRPGTVIEKLTRDRVTDAMAGTTVPAGRRVWSEAAERAAVMAEAAALMLLAEALGQTAADVRAQIHDEMLDTAPDLTERQTQRLVRDRVIASAVALDPAAFSRLLQTPIPGVWAQVRKWLSEVSSGDGLTPAEHTLLWQRPMDRIETLIAALPGRHRDLAYHTLVRAGITSITQLATVPAAQLAALGLRRSVVVAIRVALAAAAPAGGAAVRPEMRDRHLAADLATRTDWTQADLAVALRIAAGLPPAPDLQATPELLDDLRALAEIARFAALADVLLARDRAGLLTDADRAQLPVAALDLLVRARAGALTEAELQALVRHGSGALRRPGGLRAIGQREALLVLDAHLQRTGAQPGDARGWPATVVGGRGGAAGAGGGPAAVLGGDAAPVLVAGARAGAGSSAAATDTGRVVRNRGPPNRPARSAATSATVGPSDRTVASTRPGRRSRLLRAFGKGAALVGVGVALAAAVVWGPLSGPVGAVPHDGGGRVVVEEVVAGRVLRTVAGDTWESLAARLPGVSSAALAAANLDVRSGVGGVLPEGSRLNRPGFARG